PAYPWFRGMEVAPPEPVFGGVFHVVSPGLPSLGWDLHAKLPTRTEPLRHEKSPLSIRIGPDRIERMLRRQPTAPAANDAADQLVTRLLHGIYRTAPVYRSLVFGGRRRVFTDLPSYAPGMNTSRADVLAVLETEAEPDPEDAPGQIDPAAALLID